MRALFVPDFMYETIAWGIKYIDIVLLLLIALTIYRFTRLIRDIARLNDDGEFE